VTKLGGYFIMMEYSKPRYKNPGVSKRLVLSRVSCLGDRQDE
jgi:hypothetical protein